KGLEAAKAELEQQRGTLSGQVVDRERLLFRIRRTIANLERTPVELQRPIYANLIKFAELKSTKVRLGLFAPAHVVREAPAGTGPALPSPETTAGTDSLSAMRAGSCSVSNGAEGRT